FFDTSGEWVGSTPTDVDGNYLSSALSEGTYFAKTWNDQAYIDELFDDIACYNICDIPIEGQPIVVVASQATTGVDFDLDPGGTFSGTNSSVVGGAPIEYVIVDIFNTAGEWVSNTSSQVDGSYISLGLPAGDYFARTYNDEHYLNELYDDIACPFFCDPIASSGTTIAVVVGENNAGKDFDLAAGGYISGSITAIGGEPIAEVAVDIFDFQGDFVAWGMTEVDGNYSTTPGMPTGSYFAVTSAPRPFLNEIYDDHYCPSWCDPLAGTEIPITAGTEMAGVDFVLTSGGMISGTVRNAAASEGLANIWVEFFDPTGNHVGSALTGTSGDYLSQALPGGIPYFAKTWNDLGYLDELFQEQPCAFGCDITTAGTPIPVIVDATVLLIDFTLEQGAFFDPSGNWLSNAITDDGGNDISQALPAGTYYARSWNELGYLNELYDDIPCPNWCEPPTGTAIVAATGESITDIDFDLDLGGLVSGTVVEDPSDDPIEGIYVDFFDIDGNHVSWGDTGSSGDYLTFYALSPGTYYAKTWNDLGYADELFDDISCVNCDPTQGVSFEVSLASPPRISTSISRSVAGSPARCLRMEPAVPSRTSTSRSSTAKGAFMATTRSSTLYPPEAISPRPLPSLHISASCTTRLPAISDAMSPRAIRSR
ncbi:MAG: carboxypeptidase-like regulatory domain-containing protein, partial [Acidobacteriota bacterium]